MKRKSNRLEAIIEIVNSMEIDSQEALLVELSKRGFDVTQATLSRSLKEIGVAKITTKDGRYRYAMHVKPATRHANFPRNLSFVGYNSIAFSGNMMVVRTNPGYAGMIASEIDKRFADLVLGTIAGEDTIISVMRDESLRDEILDRIRIYLPHIDHE